MGSALALRPRQHSTLAAAWRRHFHVCTPVRLMVPWAPSVYGSKSGKRRLIARQQVAVWEIPIFLQEGLHHCVSPRWPELEIRSIGKAHRGSETVPWCADRTGPENTTLLWSERRQNPWHRLCGDRGRQFGRCPTPIQACQNKYISSKLLGANAHQTVTAQVQPNYDYRVIKNGEVVITW